MKIGNFSKAFGVHRTKSLECDKDTLFFCISHVSEQISKEEHHKIINLVSQTVCQLLLVWEMATVQCMMSSSLLISADWKSQAVDPVMIRKLLLQLADYTSLSEPLKGPRWVDILCILCWLDWVVQKQHLFKIQLEGKSYSPSTPFLCIK